MAPSGVVEYLRCTSVGDEPQLSGLSQLFSKAFFYDTWCRLLKQRFNKLILLNNFAAFRHVCETVAGIQGWTKAPGA